MKNALTIASQKLYEPSDKWNPADEPEMLLPFDGIFLKNLFYDFIPFVFSEP
ncbi:hypothetical protein WYG_2934 [Citrobacter sp. A1]|nr:hypothetical protein WYG_2934 [Citrobacter sp. A1]EKU32231.1 hypothetical protein B397_4414 [Citrobacter sp. L17]EME3609511.1 hypothetical protein [Yersinia enterocolitica]VAF86453.1 Uncharacterised protein [Enterobacter hormaechei]VEI11819.1 Uncharacterised protein [Klebsiella aerogenes]